MGTAFWIRSVAVVLFSIIGIASVVILQSQSNQSSQLRGSTRLFEPIDNLLNPNQNIDVSQEHVAPKPVPTFTPTLVATATFTPTANPTNTPTATAITVIQQPSPPTAMPVVVVELQPTNTPLPPNPNDPNVVCNNLTAQKDREACWWRWHNELPLIEESTPTPMPTPIILVVTPTLIPTNQQFLDVQPSRITYKIRPDSDILRGVFSDNRFQTALHHAINCHEINHAVYHGRASPQQLCKVDEYNLDMAHAFLDELGLVWDALGVYRMRPDGEIFSWAIESINNNQQTNDILKLCRKHFETIGLNMIVKQINEPATTIPAHAISTTAIGSGTCVDWIALFVQSPKAPCTTQAEKQYLLAVTLPSPTSLTDLLSGVKDVLEDYGTPIPGHEMSQSEFEFYYDKVIYRGLNDAIQRVEEFEQLTPPISLQHIHAHYETAVNPLKTSHGLIQAMLESRTYNPVDADIIKAHAESFTNFHETAWEMIKKTCDYYPPGGPLGPHGLIGERDFFDDLD